MPTRHSGSEAERLALDVFIKLNRACTSLGRRVHGPLRDLGLTPIQFGVLDVIYYSGPVPVSAIAEKNLCSQNSLSSVIDTMERNGLVRRDRSEEDRRVVNVAMTEAGRSLFERAWPEHLRRIVQTSQVLTQAELKTLDGLLRKLGRGE